MEKKHRDKDIPEGKLKSVDELIDLIKNNRSMVIVSIKNLPSSQFQAIKKKLRKSAVLQVVKKSIIGRAIDKIEKGSVKNLKKHLQEDTAILFSKLDPFEVSLMLSKNKSMARAKVGQIVEENVVIEPGPTEFVPGPIVSELGSLGIKFMIEDGKISIREKKIILKAKDKVTEQAASIMAKLDMKPIAVGLEPVIAYDSDEDKVYENIKIDADKILEELKTANSKALAFAVKIVYICKESLGFLLRKALAEGKALEKKVNENVGIHNKSEENKSVEVK